MAYHRAIEQPTDYTGQKLALRSKEYRRFLDTARHLQAMQGDEDICLPRKLTGQVMGKGSSTIADWCAAAVDDGFLVERGDYFHPTMEGAKARQAQALRETGKHFTGPMAKPYRFVDRRGV